MSIVHEWDERLGQSELQILIVQLGHFDLVPQILDILRIQGAIPLHPVDRENNIVTRDRRAIMPGRVRTDREVIDLAILRDPPGFGQVGPWLSIFVKADQAAEEQLIHIPVGGVVPVEQGIQTPEGTDESLGVNAPLLRLRKDRSGNGGRLLAEQQNSHDPQGNHDDQYLPA